MIKLAFNIDAWSAWSESRCNRSEWLKWATDQKFVSEKLKPDVSMIPPMKRRRMSTLSRMALATAMECVHGDTRKPICVFASRHGELTRTVKLIRAMAEEQDVSPTDFAMSVHNTAAGLFSIFTGNTLPSTTVVGQDSTLVSAFIEAIIYLDRFPRHPVLLVLFDEPLPLPLDHLPEAPEEASSIALLLSISEKPNLKIEQIAESYSDRSQSGKTRDDTVEFLRFFLGGQKEFQVAGENGIWRWTRTDAGN